MYIVGISGASGAIIGVRLVEELLRSGSGVMAIVSEAGRSIIDHEITRGAFEFTSLRDLLQKRNALPAGGDLREYGNNDFFAPPASGSFGFRAMIVAPCSMKTLASVANGFADSLIARAADVALKERRPCVLVPRETPLALPHLENMVKAKRAGADILVPAPAFYGHPSSADDLVNFIVGKILGLLGIEHALFRPWGDSSPGKMRQP